MSDEYQFSTATVEQVQAWAAKTAQPVEELLKMLEQNFSVLTKIKKSWPSKSIEKEALREVGSNLKAFTRSPAIPIGGFFTAYGEDREGITEDREWQFRNIYGYGRPLAEDQYRPIIYRLQDPQSVEHPPPLGVMYWFRGNPRKDTPEGFWSFNEPKPPVNTLRNHPNILPEFENFDAYLWLETINDDRYTKEELEKEDTALEVGWHKNDFICDFGDELMAWYMYYSQNGTEYIPFERLVIVNATLAYLNPEPASSGNHPGRLVEPTVDFDDETSSPTEDLGPELPVWMPDFIKALIFDDLGYRPSGYFVGRPSLTKRYDRESRVVTDEDVCQLDITGFIPNPFSTITAEELRRLQTEE